MSAFEAILLDVDGTLVDSNDAHAEAWARTFRSHGYDIPFEEIRDRIGKGGDKVVMEMIGLEDDDPKSKEIREDRTDLFLEEIVSKLHAFPGARELVRRMLDEGFKVLVASSAQAKELEPLLKIAHVDDLIEHRTSSDDAEKSKPDPDIVLAAVEKTGLPASRVVMLGDTPYDVEAATRAGVAVIAVRSGGWGADDLKGAIAVYDDVADLLDRYDESPLGATVHLGRSDA